MSDYCNLNHKEHKAGVEASIKCGLMKPHRIKCPRCKEFLEPPKCDFCSEPCPNPECFAKEE